MTTVYTDSGVGNVGSTYPEYGMGYIRPWGFILHSESVSIENSRMDTGAINLYRQRNFTHTLNITGTILYAYAKNLGIAEPVILNAKDELVNYFYNNRAVQILLNAGLFPSIPNDDIGNVVWEPVSLNFQEGPWVSELKYSATLVYKRHPKDADIGTISIFGVNLWDRTNVSYRKNYDRITKKINETTTASASIKCPDNMSWSKALIFYDAVKALQRSSVTANGAITDVEVSKNYDDQTVSYTISGLVVLDRGDAGKYVRIFGYDWPAIADISIDATTLKMSHLATSDATTPYQQNITLSFTVTAPEDIDELSNGLVFYSNATRLRPQRDYDTFADSQYQFGITKQWTLDRITHSFNIAKKTVSVNIAGYRVIRPAPINKNTKMTSTGQGFLWEGSSVTTSFSNEIESLLFSENVSVQGQAQIPQDMDTSDAQAIVTTINALNLFDRSKYPGYKLMNKQAYYDIVTRQLTYSVQAKKIDFYDPFVIESNGTVRYRKGTVDSDRAVSFAYGVFSGISGIQFDITVEENYSRSENGDEYNRLTINGRILADNHNATTYQLINGSNVNTALNALWAKYVNTKTDLNNHKYILESFSRRIATVRMEGSFTLNFSDFGRVNGDSSIRGNAIYWPTEMRNNALLIVNPVFDMAPELERWLTSTDGWSDGFLYQTQGLNVRTISMSGTIHRSEFTSSKYRTKERAINARINSQGGFINVYGVRGRVRNFSISGIDLVKKSAKINVSIEIQPSQLDGMDPTLVDAATVAR